MIFNQLVDQEQFVLVEFEFFLDWLEANECHFIKATSNATSATLSTATAVLTTATAALTTATALFTASALSLALSFFLLAAFLAGSVASLSFFLSLSDRRQHHGQREADAGKFHETLHLDRFLFK